MQECERQQRISHLQVDVYLVAALWPDSSSAGARLAHTLSVIRLHSDSSLQGMFICMAPLYIIQNTEVQIKSKTSFGGNSENEEQMVEVESSKFFLFI